MRTRFTLIAMLCASSAGAADIQYAGKADCRVAEHARVAGQQAYWDGACKDGYASGSGALQWSKDGKATERYEGNLSKGVPEGEGIAQWEDGSLYEGTYHDGKLHGAGTIVFADKGELTGRFEHGASVGDARFVDVDGDRYEGGWQDGPEGYGTRTFALGGAYRGQWQRGKPVGEGEILYPNGQVLKATFKGSFQLTEQPQKPATPQFYSIKHTDAPTGSNITQVAASNFIVPPQKPYADLTPEQQRIVREIYTILQDDDAPPYPLKGKAEVARAMGTLITYMRETGKVSANVSVDEQGVAQSVSVIKSPSDEVRKVVAAIFLQIKYTPGRCAGQPCAMMVPFKFKLSDSSGFKPD
ncbi:energy transducer TonB [Janthinobacterium sp. Mn2066]|uniref:energy transducer TonB n=1 Tax=Janthinobacterium sp. Mn2066 TaxID=3395264 RepID=UPI003BC20C89